MLHRQKRKKRMIQLKLWCLLGGMVALCFFLDRQLRPIIQTVASSQATMYAVQSINDAATQEMVNHAFSYQQLIHLSYDEGGAVSSLQADIVAMNLLQSNITDGIIQRILQFESQEISVPLGTLLGSPVFSDRGPQIGIRIIPASFIETQICNRFDSAGINQTRHQIFMNVKLTIYAVIPGYSVTSQIDTDILLAETVLVGTVPEAYTQVGDGTDPLVGMIQDYDAQHRLD